MKQYSIINITLSILAMFALGGAQASPLVSQMDAYRIEHKNGKDILVEANEAPPGSIIEYKLTYTNSSEKPISIQNIAAPIPENTAYIVDSACTMVESSFQVSIDGGESWKPEPIIRMAKDANGNDLEIIVPASDYTHVRWSGKSAIAPGQTQVFHYRVKVS